MELTTQKEIKTLYNYLKYLDYNYNLDFEICEYITEEEAKDIEEVEQITDILENNGAFDIEIIYYSNAIKYLQENDASLNESINIAFLHGYELKNLNSGNKVNLSPHQVSFLTRHSHASVWLAVFRRRELFLYKGSSAVEVVESGLKAEPHAKLTTPADWNIFFSLLSHSNSE